MIFTVTSLAACRENTRARYLSGAEAVFWETANTTEFESPAERSAFQWRYFDYYALHAPEFFFVAVSEEAEPTSQPTSESTPQSTSEPTPQPTSEPPPEPTVLGYICGVADTRAHAELYRVAAHVPIFDDLYTSYPAHLHINLTAASRGLGLGGRLVESLSSAVAAAGAGGIHLVTSPGARNVSFYRRQGFIDAVERTLPTGGGQGVPLLFLGKHW